MATRDKQLLDEMSREHPWFVPPTPPVMETIESLVQTYQDRLKPFGLKDLLPCEMIKIWPGKTPREISKFYQDSKTSIVYMVMENITGMVRDVIVKAGRMARADTLVHDVRNKVQSAARRGAIEVAGLTLRATMPIPITINKDGSRKDLENMASDLDVVGFAVEDAVRISSNYVFWAIVDDLMTSMNYLNPYAPLLELFQLGLWPLGAIKNQYIVFVPSGKKGVC